MAQATSIKVYLQALGAHFLGVNAYNTHHIKVNLVYSGGVLNLPYTFPATPNDGVPQKTFTDGQSSFMPIITVPSSPAGTQTVTFLNTNQSTICATASNFQLPQEIELAHLDISIPTTTVANPIHLKYPVFMSPLRHNYNITVAIPGLYVSQFNMPPGEGIGVLVKMMCGCPITDGKSLWHANDFIVQASVLATTGQTTLHTLHYTNNPKLAPNSLFSVMLPHGCNPRSITYTAQQKSTGNYGTLAVTM